MCAKVMWRATRVLLSWILIFESWYGVADAPVMLQARADRVKKNDPDALLAQFLKDRREERKSEVAQVGSSR